MSIKPREDFTAEWYTPASEKDEEEPTRFKLKPLNSVQTDYALDGATYGEKGELIDLSPKGKITALGAGLVDWENFDCKFKVTNIHKIPWVIRQELAMEIITNSVISEDDSKNS